MLGIYWGAQQLLAFQQELSSIEIISLEILDIREYVGLTHFKLTEDEYDTRHLLE
jgi:hypothetical protein